MIEAINDVTIATTSHPASSLFRLLSRQVAELVEASMATISSCPVVAEPVEVCCDIIAIFISPALSPRSQRVLHTHFDCRHRCRSHLPKRADFLSAAALKYRLQYIILLLPHTSTSAASSTYLFNSSLYK